MERPQYGSRVILDLGFSHSMSVISELNDLSVQDEDLILLLFKITLCNIIQHFSDIIC